MNWKEGNATTATLILQTATQAAGGGGGTGATVIGSQSIEALSMYVGLAPGVAYKINDMVSVALSGRYLVSYRNVDAHADFLMDAIGAVPGSETSVALDSEFDYNARAGVSLPGPETKEPARGRLFGTAIWCPGEDSNLHTSRR